MDSALVVGIFAFGCGMVVAFALWWSLRKRGGGGAKPHIYSSIEDIRSVGELVVFKIITKEIVTTAEHWFGQWG